MQLSDNLAKIGLNEKQIEIYLVLLQIGEASIQEIIGKTKIKRTTVYSTLDTLVARGLVTFLDKGWHRTYFAENPKKVSIYFQEKQREIKDQESRFLDCLPELASLYNKSSTKPKVRLYEGVEGIKQIYEETLLLKPKEEMLAYGQATLIHKILGDDWVESYLSRRKKKKIFQRAIVEDSEDGRFHQRNDSSENRQTILIPEEMFPFVNEINIFASKIAIVSFKELMGVIIESADVAKTQRSIFELAWKGAKAVAGSK